MIISSHVPAGALVGVAARRPLVALAAGFASHLVMDALPHWGTGPNTEPEWMPIARKDGVAGLAAIALLTANAPRERRLAVVAGITGACLPDTDKLGRYFVGRSPWPSRFDRFHEAIQNEARHRLPREVATALALTAVGTALLRSLRARSAAAAAPPAGSPALPVSRDAEGVASPSRPDPDAPAAGGRPRAAVFASP